MFLHPFMSRTKCSVIWMEPMLEMDSRTSDDILLMRRVYKPMQTDVWMRQLSNRLSKSLNITLWSRVTLALNEIGRALNITRLPLNAYTNLGVDGTTTDQIDGRLQAFEVMGFQNWRVGLKWPDWFWNSAWDRLFVVVNFFPLKRSIEHLNVMSFPRCGR